MDEPVTTSALRVLVTSDTHVASAALLPAALLELAVRADHVLHAGDHSSADVVDVLAACAPVTAVHGNVEQPEVVHRLPERATVVLGGVSFGIVHDAGPAGGRHERLEGWFPRCDVRVYGHTHMPEASPTRAGTWTINPGSPTQRRRAPSHSIAWVELDGGAVTRVTIVDL